MSTETLEIRQLARQFAESELRPHVEAWDHERRIDDPAITQLAELGFFGVLVDFELPAFISAIEEIAWGEPGVALLVAINNMAARRISSSGSDAQKTRWLEALTTGAALACIAQSEEDGSALEARRDGEQWILNGRRNWVTNAPRAAVALVPVNGNLLLVPTDAAGVTVGPRADTLGLRVLEICDITFENVRVDSGSVIAGARAPQGDIDDMLAVAAIAVGISQAALDYACGYADVREQFNEKLRSFEGVQFKLADMRTRVEAARALLQKVTEDPTPAGAGMAKLFASETAMWVSTQAVQIFGGYGYMRDYPVEKLMRDAKATELLGGLNEVQRVNIARDLYE